tara:strand:- start:1039 stop:1944 length:906 start_codon:yes stop_codon:yes gene_type:complete
MIACDLIRNLRMYSLPMEKFYDFRDDIVFIDPENPPKSDKVEIYLGDRINKNIIDRFPNLKWIHLTSVGFDKLIGLDRDDIIITNSKGIMDSSIISHTLGFIFSLSRGMNYCIKDKLDRYKFEDYFYKTEDVGNKTCLIAGMGNIGNKLKTILELLDMKVIGITSKNIDKLDEYVGISDFVVNLLPYTNETKSIFDKKVLGKFKLSSYFINIGRGQTVVEEDLIYVLKNNLIAGAGLDVFEKEPLSDDSELWNLDNVILTPHIAGLSKGYWDKQYKLFKDNFDRYKNSEEMINRINLKRGY